MTLIIQILFFLVIYIIFFRGSNHVSEYSELSLRRALDRLRTTWDFDELKEVFYQEAQNFPHVQQMLYNAYINQQRILQGLALEEQWAYKEVRHLMQEKLSHCHSQEMLDYVHSQFETLLKRHPSLNDMFYRPHKRKAPSTKKRLFSSCHSIPDIKKRFRKLAFLNHPDRGGSSAAMQEILRQYEEALELQKQR